MYNTKTIKEYIEDLAAKKPAPGGGSAAALAGALGTALLAMAANYTIGKDKYKEFEREAFNVLMEAEVLQRTFRDLVDADVEAYSMLSCSRSHKTLKEATRVPLLIAQTAQAAFRQALRLAGACNPLLISDVGVAAELLAASYAGAKATVSANLNRTIEEEFVRNSRQRIEVMDKEVALLKEKVKSKVKSIMEKAQ